MLIQLEAASPTLSTGSPATTMNKYNALAEHIFIGPNQ